MFSPRVLIIAIGGFLLVGGIFAARYVIPRDATVDRSVGTWANGGTIPPSETPSTEQTHITIDTNDVTNDYATLPEFTFNQDLTRTTRTDPLAELHAYFSSLTNTTPSTKPADTSSNPLNFFSFSLGPVVNTSQTIRTPEQQALYTYGNEAGRAVQTLNTFGSENNQLLLTFFEDPSDETEKGVKTVAARLQDAANTLRDTTTPDGIQTAATELIHAYDAAAAQLATLGTSRTDEEILANVTTYNERSVAIGNNMITMMGIFADATVTFESSEPGSVFMFTFAQ